MARLFTAIELSADARRRVLQRRGELAAALATGAGRPPRLVPPEQLHLTLVFIGEVEESRVADLIEAMSREIPLQPFDLRFSACGIFPSRGPAQVLWFGVGDGTAQVTSLFEIATKRLESAGIPRERRPFVPHLTVARWGRLDGPDARHRLPDVGEVAAQQVSAVTLFRSVMRPSGAEHSVLARAPLAGGFSALH